MRPDCLHPQKTRAPLQSDGPTRVRYEIGGCALTRFLKTTPPSAGNKSRNWFSLYPFLVVWLDQDVRWVVFLRAVNVGKANRCQPAAIARELSKLGVINVGAVGTFVVREKITESALRLAIASTLPFKCESMICPAHDIVRLASKKPFGDRPSDADITRFVNILAKPPPSPRPLPLCLPSDGDWLLKIIAIENRFVLGLYRRQMRAIRYLGKVERLFGVPATTRNWNTIQKVAEIIKRTPSE